MPTLSELKLIGLGILAAVLIYSSVWVTHKVDSAKYTALELSIAQAQEKAVRTALDRQIQLDETKTQIALEAGQHQQKIINQTRSQLSGLQRYVKDSCVSWASYKLFNSVILGISPDSVSTPAGKSLDSCTTLRTIDITRSFIDNISIAKQNGQQLDDLIGAIHKMYDPQGKK